MVTEFVGTNRLGDTIGLVIANIDSQLKEKMNIGTRYNSIGIVGARTGAGPHIFAADEAVNRLIQRFYQLNYRETLKVEEDMVR